MAAQLEERSVYTIAADLVKPLRQIPGRFEITTTTLYVLLL